MLYAIGLICVIAVRLRHRFDYLEDEYSLAEAFLWLGIYLAINLQLSSLDLRRQWWGGGTGAASEFARPFYWTTWVLIWCLPPVVLARGVRQKDRFVIAVGAIAAILTFVSNKPYLGWPRHTWDPMLLGILLTGVALFIRRWLARGPGGIRRGFTAARLSGKDKQWMNAGSAVLGLVTPQSITPSPQPTSADVPLRWGSFGRRRRQRRFLKAPGASFPLGLTQRLKVSPLLAYTNVYAMWYQSKDRIHCGARRKSS